jgi:hypothetical protein
VRGWLGLALGRGEVRGWLWDEERRGAGSGTGRGEGLALGRGEVRGWLWDGVR